VAKASSKKPSAVKQGGKSAAAAAKSGGGKSGVAAKAAGKPVAAAAKPGRSKSAKDNGQKTAPAAVVKAAARVELKPVKSAAAVVTKAEKPMKKSKDADRGDRKGVAVPAPVPTDVKPSKNQAGLRAQELEHFRDLLLAKRRELVGDMSSMEREALQRGGSSNLSNLPLHMADMGTDNYEQEFTLGLMEKDRNLLREINNALAKIQDGTYGLCEGTGLPISKPRLEAQPWARFSIEHARKLEQRMGR
jgi:RNA polymerase-binding protein DksA